MQPQNISRKNVTNSKERMPSSTKAWQKPNCPDERKDRVGERGKGKRDKFPRTSSRSVKSSVTNSQVAENWAVDISVTKTKETRMQRERTVSRQIPNNEKNTSKSWCVTNSKEPRRCCKRAFCDKFPTRGKPLKWNGKMFKQNPRRFWAIGGWLITI